MSNIFPFGYKDYNDALHNGVLYTQSELQNVKSGDTVIVLTMTDSDDNYSLENRLFEFTVDSVNSNGFNAGGFWVDLPNFDFEYFLILHPKDYVPSERSETNESPEPPTTPKIGEFKTKDKFIEFIGGSSNVNFLSNEATIEGKQLSGLDFDGITFKLTICDEGTVDFVEVDTNLTTSEQRSRLLELISEKTIVPYRKRMCVRELEFRSIHKVKGDTIPLYLSVEYVSPYNKLQSLFDDEETETPQISDEQSSKLDELFSMFEDDFVEEVVEEEVVTSEVPAYKSTMEAQFEQMKMEKVNELKNRLADKEKEVLKFENDIKQSEKKVEEAKAEVKLLEDRLETLYPQEPLNGFYFNVSERLNEKINLEPEVDAKIRSVLSKVKTIRVDAFMKLFEDGEYQIRLGKKNDDGVIEEFTDMESLPDEVKANIKKLGAQLEILDQESVKDLLKEAIANNQNVATVKVDYKLMYRGDMGWGTIVQKMIKLGFSQEASFDKMCGSNSYQVTGKYDESDKAFNEATVGSDGSLSWDDEDEDFEEMYGEYKRRHIIAGDDDFIFSIYEDEDASNDCGDPKIVFSISPLSYFKNEGACFDQHLEHLLKQRFPAIKAMGDAFEEVEEGSFDIYDEENDCHWETEQIVDFLCKTGIKPSISYQKWCSEKDLQTLTDAVNKLGHQKHLIS